MPESSRTLLTEHRPRGESTPVEQTIYNIIRCRLPGIGGYACNSIQARLIDNHFLLTVVYTANRFSYEPFGIVDVSERQVALQRMYDKARKIANEVARKDRNTLVDLTSRAEMVTGNDRFFVPEKYMHRCARDVRLHNNVI